MGAQLRLHKIRKHLKEQVADRDAVQTYVCPRCANTYTSLDAARLFDPAHNGFMCEECGWDTSLAHHTHIPRVSRISLEGLPSPGCSPCQAEPDALIA